MCVADIDFLVVSDLELGLGFKVWHVTCTIQSHLPVIMRSIRVILCHNSLHKNTVYYGMCPLYP